MPTRKTREQLDEEMDLAASEPVPVSGADDPASEQATRMTREQLDEQMPKGEEPVSPAEPVTQEPEIGEEDVEEVPISDREDSEIEDDAEGSSDADPQLQSRLESTLESLLFSASSPVTARALTGVLRELQADISSRAVRGLIEKLRDEYRETGRGIRLAEVGGGYQLRTPSEAAPFIRRLVSRRPPRLTRATLETLAIVAYRQPVTRGEVEDIRGVDCGAVLKHLLDRRLVRIIGRKDEPGRPLVYGTTLEFLEFFSIKDLKSLPTLRDFVELSDEHRAQLGLGPREEIARVEEPDYEAGLLVEQADYSPVSQDGVIQELSEVLDEVKRKDRRLRQTFGEAQGTTGLDSGDGAAEGPDESEEGGHSAADGSEEDGEDGESE